MTGFLLALLAAALVGFGARDHVLLAAMTARQGVRPALLVVALVCALAATAVAAGASQLIAERLNANARLVFAGIALALAGSELLLSRPVRQPREPTQSLAAFGLVLLAYQLTDAVRFLVLAIAVAVRAPLAAGLGGAVAALALALGAWLGADALLNRSFVGLRRALGVMILLFAGWLIVRGMDMV